MFLWCSALLPLTAASWLEILQMQQWLCTHTMAQERPSNGNPVVVHQYLLIPGAELAPVLGAAGMSP